MTSRREITSYFRALALNSSPRPFTASKLQPVSQSLVESLTVSGSERADDLYDQSFFHCGDLSLDAGWDVQSSRAPFLDWKVRVGKHRGNGNEKQIRSIAANDYGRAYLAAGQVRERNRQENDVIS